MDFQKLNGVPVRRFLARAAVLLTVVLTTTGAVAGESLERITFGDSDGDVATVEGRVLVEAVDGGIMLLGRDGQLWNITPEQLQQRETTGENFEPLSAAELGQQLKEEFGDGFEIVTTRNYVICSNAGRKYAQWCGALFERLMASFLTHWRRRPLQLDEPEFPLAAIVFADEDDFSRFAAKDAGAAAADAKGYYSIRTNRIVLHDLTAGANSGPSASVADINRKVAAAPFNVATIVHEATHQIAFNCGLHTRYADNPLWLTEGMAMYFETPDLNSRSGWRTVGQINPWRLRQFQDYAASRREPDSLETLLAGDERFGDADLAADAYAEAWALTYFLIRTKRAAYMGYLRQLADKPPLIRDTPEQRLEEFQEAFGPDLDRLDRDFLRYVRRLGR